MNSPRYDRKFFKSTKFTPCQKGTFLGQADPRKFIQKFAIRILVANHWHNICQLSFRKILQLGGFYMPKIAKDALNL